MLKMDIQTKPTSTTHIDSPRYIIANQTRNSQSRFVTQQGNVVTLFLLVILCLVVIGGGGLYMGYWMGVKQSTSRVASKSQRYDKIKSVTDEQNQRIQVLKKTMSRLQQERDTAISNMSTLRREQSSYDVEIKKVDQLNNILLKQLSDKGGVELQIMAANVEPLPDNVFEYQFDVLRVDEDNETVTMKVGVLLYENDLVVKVPVEPNRYDINGIARIRGRFVAPKGFEPNRLLVTLEAGSESLEQNYRWSRGKKINDQPLSLADVPPITDEPISP